MRFLLLLVIFFSCETLTYAATQDVPGTLAEIQTFADLREYAQAADLSESTIESIGAIESTYLSLTDPSRNTPLNWRNLSGQWTTPITVDPSILQQLLVQIVVTRLMSDTEQVGSLNTTVGTLTATVTGLDGRVVEFTDRIDALDTRIDWVIGLIVAILLAVSVPRLSGSLRRWQRARK